MFTKKFFEVLDKKLDEVAEKIFLNSQEIIIKKRIVDEGTLLKSGNINRNFLEKTVIYNVPYAESIEYGRLPGSRPPFEEIYAWVKRKGIRRDDSKIFAFSKYVVKKIEREGTEPRPFLLPAVQKVMNEMRLKQ